MLYAKVMKRYSTLVVLSSAVMLLCLCWAYLIKPHTLKTIEKQSSLAAERVALNFSVQATEYLDTVNTIFAQAKAVHYKAKPEFIEYLDVQFRNNLALVSFTLPPVGIDGTLVLFNPYISYQEQQVSKEVCDAALEKSPERLTAYHHLSVIQMNSALCVYDKSHQMIAILNLQHTLNAVIQAEALKGYFLMLSEESLPQLYLSGWHPEVLREEPFKFLGTEWNIYIYPSKAYVKERLTHAFLVFFVTLISGAGLFFWWFLRYNTAYLPTKKYVARLKKLALYDGVTNLPNRRYCLEQLEQSIKHAKSQDGRFSLCFMDCNDFKNINDDYGHAAGDKVLRHIADEVSAVIRQTDIFARFSGDEFCLILDNVYTKTEIEIVLSKILKAVSTPIFIGEAAITVSVSIGVVVYPFSGKTSDVLLKHADEAMYRAKGTHQNNFVVDVAVEVADLEARA